LDLFRFIHGKVVFEAFYKKDLARRLLMGRSASADAERSMLSKLETECGSNFTQNLSQMFKDIELGREEMMSYKEFLTDLGSNPKVDLNVSILSSSAWPSYPDIKVNIPKEVLREIERFEQHYKSKHSGRKLEWKHALAHCQLRATFPKGRKEIVVSSFQAIVLLLFNGVGEDEHVSYERLLAETGLRKSFSCFPFGLLTNGFFLQPTTNFSELFSLWHARSYVPSANTLPAEKSAPQTLSLSTRHSLRRSTASRSIKSSSKKPKKKTRKHTSASTRIGISRHKLLLCAS
jgi:hypothetical protein